MGEVIWQRRHFYCEKLLSLVDLEKKNVYNPTMLHDLNMLFFSKHLENKEWTRKLMICMISITNTLTFNSTGV